MRWPTVLGAAATAADLPDLNESLAYWSVQCFKAEPWCEKPEVLSMPSPDHEENHQAMKLRCIQGAHARQMQENKLPALSKALKLYKKQQLSRTC